MVYAPDLFSLDVPAPVGSGTFQTVYADPPWLEAGGGEIQRGADRHYPLMKTDEIRVLPVRTWAAPDAHLYLWVTNNFLEDGLDVMRAWGFRYVTKIDWLKVGEIDPIVSADPRVTDMRAELMERALQIGLGQYFRGCTESCLFGVRGQIAYQLKPDGTRAQGRTAIIAPRGEHSEKPEKMRQMIELVSPGPRLEMFARKQTPNWTVWGNEVAG